MGASVKSLHFSTLEELVTFYVMFFFGQATCHMEEDPEDEQIFSGKGWGRGSLEMHH